MTITLDLPPEIEQGLLSQARERGVSLKDYVQEIVAREAHVSQLSRAGTLARNLVEVCAMVRGLADDLDISRNPSAGRPVDLS